MCVALSIKGYQIRRFYKEIILFYKYVRQLSVSEFQSGDSDLCGEKFREIVFVVKADGICNLLYRHIGFKKKTLPLGKAFSEYILLWTYVKYMLEVI